MSLRHLLDVPAFRDSQEGGQLFALGQLQKLRQVDRKEPARPRCCCGLLPVVDIRPGDQVLATDPQTGATRAEPVTQLHRNLDTELADVTVEGHGGDQAVQTTPHHPFCNATTRNWTDAGDLQPGDALLGRGGPATVTAVQRHPGNRIMHNLTVANLHTYYVMAGTTSVLVHNCGSAGKHGGRAG